MREIEMDIRFPDGTVVRPASLDQRDTNAYWRAYGLYCDPGWRPDWPSDVLGWPDFGLPANWEMAATLIRQVFERARTGEHVEIGCRGGLGRTGTILACLAVLAGVPVNEAVTWVRHHYHPDAVETPEQERWVAWFGKWVMGWHRAV